MKRWISVLLTLCVVMVAPAVWAATSTKITINFKGGPFTDKTAMAYAQQVFNSLSAQSVGYLDPSVNLPFTYQLLGNNTILSLTFQIMPAS